MSVPARLRSLHFIVYLWLLGVVGAYYAVWGAALPFSAAGLVTLYNVGYAALALSAMYLTGRRIHRWIGLDGDDDAPITAMGIGVSAWIFFVSALGFAGVLHGWLIVAALVLVHCMEVGRLPALLAALPERVRGLLTAAADVRALLLWALPTGFVLVAAVQAFAPPIGPDELIHHLKGPLWRLSTHDLAFTDETRALAGMQNSAMLYVICLAGPHGDGPAKLVNLALLLLLLATVRATCRAHFPRVNSAWVVTLLLLQPVVHYVAIRPYADLLVAWLVSLGVLHAMNYVHARTAASLLLSALFLGVALGTRITMVCALAGTFAALLAVSLARGTRPRAALSAVVLHGTVAVGTTVGWLAWNWFYLGSPVYPLLGELFSPGRPLPLADSFFPDVNASLARGRSLIDLATAPFAMTFSREPPNGIWGNVPLPAYLGFLPLVLIALRRHWRPWFLLIFTTVYFVLWARNMSFMRYLMGAFPVYSLLCIDAVDRLRAELDGRRGRALYAVAIGLLVVVPAAFELFGRVADPSNVLAMHYASGNVSRAEYYDRTPYGPMFRMSEYCNRNLPEGSRIRFFGTAETYYVKVPHIADGLSHGELHDLGARAGWDPVAFRELLIGQGITHVVFHRGVYFGLFLGPNAVYGRSPRVRTKAARSVEFFQRFAAQHMHLLHREGAIELYAWKPAAPG